MATITDDRADAQVRRLRKDVEALMRNTVTPALADAVERAATTSRYATDAVRSQSEMVAGNVRGRPLLSILAAAAVGFGLGRVSR